MGQREYYATYDTQLQAKKGPNVFSTLLKVLKAFDPILDHRVANMVFGKVE